MRATGRILAAFLIRDTRIQFSYRVDIALNAFAVLLSASTFYFLAKLFGPSASPPLEAYGGDYFPFVLTGLAFSAYQGAALKAIAQNIRQEQLLGTFESILATPVRLPVLLLASAQWDLLAATMEMCLYLSAGVLLFGLRFPHANLPAAAIVFVLTLTAFLSLGLVSAAFILRYKRGDPIVWLIGTVSELLGGVFFPVAVLPAWLRGLSWLMPMTHALEGLRKTLLCGAGIRAVAPSLAALAGFTAVLMPLGIFFCSKALDATRRDGSLGHY